MNIMNPVQNINQTFIASGSNQNSDKQIAQSSSLRQIKRNNYVNDITQAYNHQTENISKGLIQQNNMPQVSPFFNINQS